MTDHLVRVIATSPRHFVASFTTHAGHVTNWSPILRRIVENKTEQAAIAKCKRNGWRCEVLP